MVFSTPTIPKNSYFLVLCYNINVDGIQPLTITENQAQPHKIFISFLIFCYNEYVERDGTPYQPTQPHKIFTIAILMCYNENVERVTPLNAH